MTGRALIDVYEGELTLRVGKEAVTFNLDQTSRYLTNYNAMMVNRIDLIDVACEEYSQEVFGFSMSGHPTPSTKPIVSNSSSTLTPFGDSDFLLEETNGDIILLEEFYNDDPSSPPLPPQDLKVVEPTIEKSSIDEPLVVELKDLPPHLEYAFLEGDEKLHVIIAKDLKDEEKTALIKTPKIKKIPHLRILMECLPTVACLLAYAMYRARSKGEKSFHGQRGHRLGHKISKNGIDVDKAKVDVISKLPHPTTVKGICSFLGHAGEWSLTQALLWRGHTKDGCPGSPNLSEEPMNLGIGSRSVSFDTSLGGVSKAWSLSCKVGMCRDESHYMG
nr:reverse transcriptase domain-containing protein [Tanacetum cinerariifolium]